MEKHKPNLILSLSLQVAVIVSLVIMAIGLVVGVDPLTILMRSAVGIVAFAVLGWAASMALDLTEKEELPIEARTKLPYGKAHPAAMAGDFPAERKANISNAKVENEEEPVPATESK